MVSMELKDLTWLGQSGFVFRAGGKNVYVDPFQLKGDFGKADLLLITHPHYDHFDRESIKRLVKDGTQIVCSQGTLTGRDYPNVAVARPGFKRTIEGIRIEAVPAYNIKPDRLKFHPRSNDWLGFVLEIDGKRIYHAGDTDFIEEMKRLKGLYLALLPCGGTYTMDMDEAIEAAKAIGAEHTAPMHYRRLLGKERSDALEAKFTKQVKGSVIFTEPSAPLYSF
jgi:L-ascorbate metabolism protein UlaG (beta-lactamase superfamily)